MNIVELENLKHQFPDGTVGLDGIRLSISKGSFVVIAGSNGSGKTTLLRHLNGLLNPTAGIVRIDGMPVSADVRRARRKVGLVFQEPDSQIVGETVASDVAFGPQNLRLDPAEVDRRVSAALESVGLKALADKPPHLLSGGEKRRLALAGILAMGPSVVAFDEPFASLDDTGVRSIVAEICRLKNDGYTVIVTTHDLEPVLFIADRLIVMQAGRIVRDGFPVQIANEVGDFGVRKPCTCGWPANRRE
ncbi:MAG: ABC transporter ATP-binding protein [Deltaproteobacteria bacterium SG8_13]|nr:MAG: ABC transporter ATP-binding protein [Deltaproteobacteria bacterium SG8_13]